MLNLHKLHPFTFPENFIWGSATAGHQIEGDNVNCQWYHQELANTDPDFEPSGKACTSWELYKEDVELLKALGHKAYRFSIEWSRIEPEKGRRDPAALARYIDLLERLKAAGIFTCVTLWHFTHPQWFEADGGFSKAENLDYFKQHIEFLVPKIAHLVDSWCVMNEFNLGAFTQECFNSKKIKLKAHGFGAQVIKSFSSAPVSSAHAYVPRVPLRKYDELDNAAAAMQNWNHNLFFFHAVRTGEIVLPGIDMEYMPELKNSCDYWAINYYHRGIVDARRADLTGHKFDFNSYQMLKDFTMPREFCPETFVHEMSRLTDKPVWITENGCCTEIDTFRIIYMMLQFEAMREAMELYKVDIRAYFHWSLLDNYEWGNYHPKFGMVSVDRETFVRIPKPCTEFYREVIEQNGYSGELFARYTPELSHFDLGEFTRRVKTFAQETQN